MIVVIHKWIDILVRLGISVGILLLTRWLMDYSTPHKDWLVVQRGIVPVENWLKRVGGAFRSALWESTGTTLLLWVRLRAKYRNGGYGMEGT